MKRPKLRLVCSGAKPVRESLGRLDAQDRARIEEIRGSLSSLQRSAGRLLIEVCQCTHDIETAIERLTSPSRSASRPSNE